MTEPQPDPFPPFVGKPQGSSAGVCVVAAAILQDGKIWAVPAPGRHHNVIQFMVACGVTLTAPFEDQGFLLSDGRFARRAPAKLVAIAVGQYKPATSGKLHLFSEDLW